MTDPRNLSIKDFTYSLPEEKIAKHPLPERDASRLLIYNKGNIEESIYRNIATYLPPGSLLVLNNTRVVEARLLFRKPSGGNIEIFCLEPHEQYPDSSVALRQQGKVVWLCLIGGASKWKHGQLLENKIQTANREIVITAKYIQKRTDSFDIELSWQPATLSFAEILHEAGAIPLPPYLKRAAEISDAERYQTVYASLDGSVAAPTAGLHFTPDTFEAFKARKVRTAFVTLHVGAGTFKPVKAATMDDHVMHAEFIDVSKDTIEQVFRNTQGPVLAAGTTSLRTIESLYWIGVKTILGGGEPGTGSNDLMIELDQWYPYEHAAHNITVREALECLLQWMDKNKLDRLRAKTKILIAPGYRPKIVKGLITNFHQPQSTLLLLVAALIGKDWKKVYDYAIGNGYRFLSYGDGSLLWISEG